MENSNRKIIHLDLTDRPDLFELLRKIARKEERTVNSQLIYWLKNHARDYIGLDEEGE